MAEEYPVWQRVSQKNVYHGRLDVIEHQAILPNGDTTTYEVVHNEGQAAAVLIKTPDNQIVLSHQFRFPLNQWIYDLPGGGASNTESPEAAAVRECREEIGIYPKKLVKLTTFHPNPGRADWTVHLFFCEEFEQLPLETDDPSEMVRKVVMSVSELNELIRAQKIVDPSLLLSWYIAKERGYITI